MDATAQQGHDAQTMRPARPRPLSLAETARLAGGTAPSRAVEVTGISLDSRELRPGDLYAALPGAPCHPEYLLLAMAEPGSRGFAREHRRIDRRQIRVGLIPPSIYHPPRSR